MEIEKLLGWLEEYGWEYRVLKGGIQIANPQFGTRKTYPVSVLEGSSLQNILLPHFIEGWHRTKGGEYLGPHHVRV